MQPSSRFTHPASIATAALVAVALLVAIALTIPATSGAANPARAAGAPSTSARVNACTSAFTYANRKIEFTGRMSALANAGGGKMQMRFDVLRRFDGGKHYRRLSADGLGDWLGNTEPTATVYVRNVALSQIETGARYMARVRYRWLDSNGKVVAKNLRTTKVCNQRAPLPDPSLLTIKKYPNPGQPTTTYDVSVYNPSKSEAINVPVSLAIDGGPPVTQTIGSISGKGLIVVTFTDMATCGKEMYGRVDPLNVIRERNELNNDGRTAC